ncbi:MAG: phosphoribosyl-AMP cyclohydrolase [Elusimicrobia bacterium CG08_land_8_20_14_0_20_44_26]|nr:MAG: phosphoribosyl-AMP cyclohydrolase [Elusimicrobia bacterium CG08_land_8_20_14_0_20_44_26]
MPAVEEIKFDANGLVPAVLIDVGGNVLMAAYMTREAFLKTIETGYAVFYSRSRKKLWLKGEESGNKMKVKEIFLDCDGDTLAIKVEPKGPACHKGYKSCFYRKLVKGNWKIIMKKEFEPGKVYGKYLQEEAK